MKISHAKQYIFYLYTTTAVLCTYTIFSSGPVFLGALEMTFKNSETKGKSWAQFPTLIFREMARVHLKKKNLISINDFYVKG